MIDCHNLLATQYLVTAIALVAITANAIVNMATAAKILTAENGASVLLLINLC